MELERVFSYPRTLIKLRSGPLGVHMDPFCAWLLRRGFCRKTIRLHLVNVAHFNEHLSRQEAAASQPLCSTDVADFFAAYPSRSRHRGPLDAHLLRVRHSVNRFVEYLSEKGLFNPLLESEPHQPLLNAYLAWMAHYQHAAAGTLELRAQYLITFLRWLGPEATPQGVATLTADRVEAFFLAYAQKVGGAARRSMQELCAPSSGSACIKAVFRILWISPFQLYAPTNWPRCRAD